MKILESLRITPQYRHESSKKKCTRRQGKTQSTRQHKISKQNSHTTWLDWHTSNSNRETRNWRISGRLSLHFRQTQNGCWDKHGFQGEINPKDDKSVYSLSLPLPVYSKGDLIVELALMHKYRIITVLLFSKTASPIFAQRKPSHVADE